MFFLDYRYQLMLTSLGSRLNYPILVISIYKKTPRKVKVEIEIISVTSYRKCTFGKNLRKIIFKL